jgi:hypothetical protein
MPDSPPSEHPPSDRRRLLPSILFIVWCLTMGTLLVYAPWLPVWSRWTSVYSGSALYDVLAHPAFRGAVSGFGVYHLVWGTHDLDRLLARFLRSGD